MPVILNPFDAQTLQVRNSMLDAQIGINNSAQQLASGKRIVNNSEEPGTIAVAQQFERQSVVLESVYEGLGAAESMLSNASKGTETLVEFLKAISTYPIQASEGYVNAEERNAIQTVFAGAIDNYDASLKNIQFNGIVLFDGSLSNDSGIKFPTEDSIKKTIDGITTTQYTSLAAPTLTPIGSIGAALTTTPGILNLGTTLPSATQKATIPMSGMIVEGARITLQSSLATAGSDNVGSPTNQVSFILTENPAPNGTDVKIEYISAGNINTAKTLQNIADAMNLYSGNAALEGLTFTVPNGTEDIVAESNVNTTYYGGAIAGTNYTASQAVFGFNVIATGKAAINAQFEAATTSIGSYVDFSGVTGDISGFREGFENKNPFNVQLISYTDNTNNVLQIDFTDNSGNQFSGAINVPDNNQAFNQQVILTNSNLGMINIGVNLVTNDSGTTTPIDASAVQNQLNAQIKTITGFSSTLNILDSENHKSEGLSKIGIKSPDYINNFNVSNVTVAAGNNTQAPSITLDTSVGRFTGNTSYSIGGGTTITLTDSTGGTGQTQIDILTSNKIPTFDLNLQLGDNGADAFANFIKNMFTGGGIEFFVNSSFDTTSITLPSLTSETLGLDLLDVSTSEGAIVATRTINEAIKTIQAAGNKVTSYQTSLEVASSTAKAQLGANQESLTSLTLVDTAAALQSNVTAINALKSAKASFSILLAMTKVYVQLIEATAASAG